MKEKRGNEVSFQYLHFQIIYFKQTIYHSSKKYSNQNSQSVTYENSS